MIQRIFQLPLKDKMRKLHRVVRSKKPKISNQSKFKIDWSLRILVVKFKKKISSKIELGKWLTHLSLPGILFKKKESGSNKWVMLNLKVEFSKNQTNLIESLIDFVKDEFKREEIDFVEKVSICDEYHLSVSKAFQIKNSLHEKLLNTTQDQFKNQKSKN